MFQATRGMMGRSGMSMPAAPAGGLQTPAPAGGLQTGSCTSLYTKLKPRPNGPGHERVARHQRARLHGATIEAVAARGYPAITVSELAALAGVSRRTFYERFADREGCFLASYDAIVGAAARRVREAWGGASGEESDVERAFAALAAQIAGEPKAARLAVLEILAAGAAGRERTERTSAALERALAQSLGGAPDRPPCRPT